MGMTVWVGASSAGLGNLVGAGVLAAWLVLDLKLLSWRDKALLRRTFLGWYAHAVMICLLYALLAADGAPRASRICTGGAVILMGGYLFSRWRFLIKAVPLRHFTGDPKILLGLEAVTAVWLWLMGMAALAVGIKTAVAAGALTLSGMGETIVLSGTANLLMLGLILRAARRCPGISLQSFLGVTRNGQPLSRLAGWPALSGFLLAGLACLVMMVRPEPPETPMAQLLGSTHSVPLLVLFVLVAVLAAPFFEEIIFRGFFFYVLGRFQGLAVTVGVIAGLFALLHVEQYWGDPAAIGMIFLVGLVLTGWRAWTGSVIPGMVAHYVFNTTMVILPVFFLIASMPSAYRSYQMQFWHLDSAAKEDLLRQTLREDPDYAAAYNDLAWIYADEGRRLGEALDLADKAMALEPKQYAFADTKAEVLFRMGRAAEAADLEADLVSQYPDDVYLRQQLKRFRAQAAGSASETVQDVRR